MKSHTFTVIIFLCSTVLSLYAQEKHELLRIGDRPPALDFTAYGSEELINWASLKGRAVVIEFWATWCPPCIKNIPHINKLVKEFGNEPVTFISITYESKEMVEKFLRKHPIQTIIGLDNDFTMFKSYKAWGIPMTVIVNKQGRIVSVLHPDHLNKSVISDVLSGKVPQVKPALPWSHPEGAENYFRSLVKKSEPEK